MSDAPEMAGCVIAGGGETLPAATACFRERGFVLVLADHRTGTGFLPPATAAEQAGAGKARDPEGYSLRRRLARALAAGIAGRNAGDFEVIAGRSGQPLLTGPARLHVSFAAREGFSLVGIAGRALGVDLERRIAPAAIPWNILRADEAETLRALPEAARAEAFLDLWTGKEAVMKALGTGLRMPPEALRITRDGIAKQRQDPSSDGEWCRLPLEVSWWRGHGVFHNTFQIAFALLSNGGGDPFEPGRT